jgi:uncharacterized protein (TIGR02266 family)
MIRSRRDTSTGAPRHFRGKPRPGRRVEVRWRVIDQHEEGPEQTAFTRNIGVGGAFIVTPDPAPPGAKLRVSLEVPPTARTVAVKAEVRWIADGDDDPQHGMGVKFSGLAVEDVVTLNDYFASLTETADYEET